MYPYANYICLALFLFILFEIFIRIYIRIFADEAFFLKYASMDEVRRFKPKKLPKFSLSRHRYLGYYPTPSWISDQTKHNQFGIRNGTLPKEKLNGELRIITIGGSNTYGYRINDNAETYPSKLQNILSEDGFQTIKVLNLGVCGYGTRECVINFLLRGLDFDPDLVIFCEGLNDVHTRFIWPPDISSGDDIVCRPPVKEIRQKFSFYENIALFRVIAIKFGAISSQLSRAIFFTPTAYEDDANSNCFSTEFLRQKRLGIYPQGVFKEQSAMKMLTENPPIYFERNVRSLIAIAKAHGVETLLVSNPYSSDFDDPVVNSDEYKFALNQHNDILKRVSQDTTVLFLDLAKLIEFDKKYFFDGRHLNESGASRMAKLIAKKLQTSFLK